MKKVSIEVSLFECPECRNNLQEGTWCDRCARGVFPSDAPKDESIKVQVQPLDSYSPVPVEGRERENVLIYLLNIKEDSR